jgi:hypothetical protein
MDIDTVYGEWCTKRFALPTIQAVDDLQQGIDVRFPDEFLDYVLRYNGGWFAPLAIRKNADRESLGELECMYGIGASHPYSELGRVADLSIFDDNDPVQILPIGRTSGNYLLLMVVDAAGADYGNIILRTFSESFLVATGIYEFFEQLHPT